MAYTLKSVTLRVEPSAGGMAEVSEVWREIVSGKLPLLHDSDGRFLQGLSPVSRYAHYERGGNRRV